MSREEMQFADPEWQPQGQLSSTFKQEQFHPQSLNIPREEHQASFDSQQRESEDKSDCFTGYKARQKQYASPPKQRQRRRAFVLRRQILCDTTALEYTHIQIAEAVNETVLKGILPR